MMKKTRRSGKTVVILILASISLLAASCGILFMEATYGGEKVFTVGAEQQNERFTFTVSMPEGESFAEMDEVFLWISPTFDNGYGYGDSSYYPLHRQKLSETQKQQDSFSFSFDFGKAASSWSVWWIDEYSINELNGFSVVAADGYRSGWNSMTIDGNYVNFEQSSPAGNYRSVEVFTADLNSEPYSRINYTASYAGLYVSDEFVEDGSFFHVRLTVEQGSGFTPVELLYQGSPVMTLNDANKDPGLSDGSIYVWKVSVNLGMGGNDLAINPDTSGSDYGNYIQIQGWPNDYWYDTKEILYIGGTNVSTLASADFDTVPSGFDSWETAVATVSTEPLYYPYTMTPDPLNHNWGIAQPTTASRHEYILDGIDQDQALGIGEAGDLNSPYGTMRNDALTLPVSASTGSQYYLYDQIWLVMDVFVDFSGSWDDRLVVEYGWFNGSGYDYYELTSYYDSLDWMWLGDPTISNGWKTVAVNFGYLSDNTPIRLRFQSDNFYDGKKGALIDNVRILGRNW